MPTLPAVFVELRATTEQFRSQLGEAQKTVKNFSDQSSTGMEKMQSVGKVAFAAVAGAAVAFGAIAVKAALEGEAAHALLVQAVQNSGTAFESVGGQVEDMSGRFAKLGFENDQVEAALARLVQSTGNVSGAMQNMGLVADFARARHIDLETAATAVGKVMNGNVGALSRLGISTKDAAGNTLSAAEALKMLNERFGGAAQAQANTYAGRLQAMNAEWHNMMETLGNALLPTLASVAGAVTDVVGWFDRHRSVVAALAITIGGPLVLAMSAYVAHATLAFGETIYNAVAGLINVVRGLVPVLGAAEAEMTGMAVAESIVTFGVAALAGAAALAAIHFGSHAAATKEAGSAAEGTAGAVEGLAGAEGELGDETDSTTGSMSAQSTLFKQLNNDANAQQSEVLKLIGDQNSLDSATKKLTESTGKHTHATEQATQHTKELKAANEELKRADDAVREAVEKQTKAQEKLNNLLKPQKPENIQAAADAHEAANDRLTRANIDVTDKQNAYNTAVAQYGPNSREAVLAGLDLNAALREVNDATRDVETTTQELGDAQRQTIGTTDEITEATGELNTATGDVTTAQGKQKEAQTNLNEVLANRGAIDAAKQDAADLATNTNAWLTATTALNTDWGKLETLIGAHPELRDQLVTQVTNMKNNLPKGADTKPLDDLLTKLNGVDINKLNALALGGMSLAGWQSHEGNRPTTGTPGPTLEEIITGGLASPAAEGAIVQARPGGTLMLVGEGGRDEAIAPLPDNWRADSVASGPGGVTIGSVTIVVQGSTDIEATANRVRDKLLLVGRNNDGVGLG